MDRTENPHPVIVVGIDGSQAAIRAAEWAVEEAVSREIPLRLLHIIPAHVEPAPFSAVGNVNMEVEYAETALRVAGTAVAATGKPVKVETEVRRGDPVAILISESAGAAMICMGSTGIGRVARALLGSTAAEVAEAAHCPVAIIRSHDDRSTRPGPLVVAAVNDSAEGDLVVESAINEAKLRHAPILAVELSQRERRPGMDLERWVQTWRASHPDVDIHACVTRDDIADFLASSNRTIELTVIGGSNADHVANLIGPHQHPIIGHAECSVLVAR